jgi:hypothetical protein
MKTCPKCARKIKDAELVCGSCGHELSSPAAAMVVGPEQGTLPKSDAQGTAPEAPKGAAQKVASLTNIQWISIVVAVLLVGALAAAMLTGWPTATQDFSAPVQPSQVQVGGDRSGQAELRTNPPESEEPSVTRWRGSRQPGWASDGSRTISFLLEADNKIPVWMKSVRPVLTVRCLAGNTEVFIVTNWAASIEPDAELHTIHLSFDNGPSVAEQWLDSDDAQALFAPDGVSMARQIARSRQMHFGFTPFNAAPATAQFNVAGFDQLVGSVAKTCRWRR